MLFARTARSASTGWTSRAWLSVLLMMLTQLPTAQAQPAAAPAAAAPTAAAPPAPAQGAAPANTSPPPAARPPSVPGAPCLIAQFRTIALDTHNPNERAVLARQWLQRNLPGCSIEKMTLLGSNRASWLGTADSAELMGLIDTAIESQTHNDPSLLRQLYEPVPRSFQPSVETIRTEPPRPIIQPGSGVMMPPIGMVNIRQGDGPGGDGNGRDKEGGPGSGNLSSGSFSDAQRRAISEHFSQSYDAGECPVGLVARGGRCQSQNPNKLWKFGEALPRELQGQAQDLPNILAEKLGPPPGGARYVRSGPDVLMLDANDRVMGAVTDFGQPAAQRRPAPRPAPAK